ncbi:flippase [Planctomycetes bacterium TBK1r]|uniref:Polysaccharide biosynthesis protein n=1 Tax=Stieleria magnilauensis TaxID=2527963 RepID=A0ABX5XHY4_9BACT|nr:Polysaccharide biosynthesis protein [Planctomycetes bacterium TBK1r]
MNRFQQWRLRGSAWGTPHRKKLAENLFWLTADKGVRIFHGIFIAAVVARYLGPADYGLIAVAASFLAIITPLITLGFDSVVVREFVTSEDRSRLFWTVFAARLLFGVLSYAVLCVLILTHLLPTESRTEAIVLLIGCMPLTTLAFDVPRLIFQSEVREKWVVWIANAALAVAAIVKLILVAVEADVTSFAAVNACAVSVTVVATMASARMLGILPKLVHPHWQTFLKLTRECWPLILSGLSIALYMNVDVVMLRLLEDPEVVGIYSVAARLSTFWFFIPMALAQTLFPGLTRAYAEDQSQYKVALFRYLRLNTLAGYATVVLAEMFVPPLIYLLFGSQYVESVPCFRLHALAILFVFLGVARAQHLNLEKLHIYGMWATVVGGIINILLNFALIPVLSAAGAAAATVLSFAISAFVMSFVFERTRWFAKLQWLTLRKPWKMNPSSEE